MKRCWILDTIVSTFMPMNSIKTLVTIICCVATTFVNAQSPKAIEADLLKSFNKIDYWDQNRNNAAADDSLEYANTCFTKKLQIYTERYPATINQSFKLLVNAGLMIISSPDGLFRIYSWDTALGGSMHKYKNLAQYKSGVNTKSMLIVTDKGGTEPFYSNLYLIKTNTKTYYLAINRGILSNAYIMQGVKIFAIENGNLNPNARLIKTKSGLHNRLDVDSDLSASINTGVDAQPNLVFNPGTQTIQIPLITAKGRITNKFISYKFTGKYFEKVSNLAK